MGFNSAFKGLTRFISDFSSLTSNFVSRIWSQVNLKVLGQKQASHVLWFRFSFHVKGLRKPTNILGILVSSPTFERSNSKSVLLQAWSGPEDSRKLQFPVYVTMAQDSGKVVSLTHRPLFTPRRYSFLLEAESTPRAIVRSEGLCQWKIPMTPSGIELATFRFVSQYLSHSATAVPFKVYGGWFWLFGKECR